MSEAYVVRETDVPCLPGKEHDPGPPNIEINPEGFITGRTRVRCKVCERVILGFSGDETATYHVRTAES